MSLDHTSTIYSFHDTKSNLLYRCMIFRATKEEWHLRVLGDNGILFFSNLGYMQPSLLDIRRILTKHLKK